MLARFYPGLPPIYDMSPNEIYAYIAWMANPAQEQGTDFDEDGDEEFWREVDRG